MQIGQAMGIVGREAEDLFWGSLLHDVGKIGIPDAVLCKPGRLTQDEFTFIMVHPERSYEILRHIDRLKGAVPGARHHQEKFDGTGYPHGLKGANIPLNARIIAVADTYDSITSSRAYRAGRSHEVAMAELKRVAGSQLDPEIIRVFEGVCALEPEWIARFKIQREPAPAAAAAPAIA
jgi:HD-GYP domain-containing protein (c-di-GMP phosphodiesterase class II)